MIIATSFSSQLAKKVAQRTKTPLMTVKRGLFPDGERYYRLVYRRQPRSAYLIGAVTHDPESLFELICLAEAAQQNGIALRSVIIPYLAYGRQDDIYEKGEPIMAQCIAHALTRIPAVRFHVISLHSDKVRDYLGPHDEIDALGLVKKRIRFNKYSTIVAPDEGAAKRAHAVVQPTQRVIVLPKTRKNKLNILRPAITLPDLRGEHVLIVDDMIDTGKTMLTAVALLKKAGVKQIDLAAAHAVWSPNAVKLLREKIVSNLYFTNSLNVKKHPKMRIIDLSEVIAERISRI